MEYILLTLKVFFKCFFCCYDFKKTKNILKCVDLSIYFIFEVLKNIFSWSNNKFIVSKLV